MAVFRSGLNMQKLRNILSLKLMIVAGIANILGFYAFDYLVPYLRTNNLWILLFVSGIFGNAKKFNEFFACSKTNRF